MYVCIIYVHVCIMCTTCHVKIHVFLESWHFRFCQQHTFLVQYTLFYNLTNTFYKMIIRRFASTNTASLQAHVKSLASTDMNTRVSALQSLFGSMQQEPLNNVDDDDDDDDDNNISTIDSIFVDDPRYTWSVSSAKGAAIDVLFEESHLVTSEQERETVAAESSSSPDALVYGCVPPRSLSALFERLLSKGALRNVVSGSQTSSFYDLGSGDGLVCMSAAMLLPFTNVVGYEILPSLVDLSKRRAILYAEISAGLSDTTESIDFVLDDCRNADWSSGRVIFANAPCYDHALMDVIGEQAEKMMPGAMFVSLGQRVESEHLELVDQVLLPANGLGKYGEPVDVDDDSAQSSMTAGAAAEFEDEENAAGLFTFNVYQRIVDSDNLSSSCDIVLSSVTDNEMHQTLRSEGAFAPVMEIMTSSQHSDKARATATLLLRSCMVSHPSMRHMLELRVLDTIFDIMGVENSMMLQVCGVLLLSELSTTRHGQNAMLTDDRMQYAMNIMLDESVSSAPVVAAGVEIAHNLSSGRRGCEFLASSQVRQSLLQLEDDGRASDVVERMDRQW